MPQRMTDLGVMIKGHAKKELTKHGIRCDRYDVRVFEEIKSESPDLKAQEKKFTGKLPTFHEFHQDVFDSLFKYTPKKEDAGAMQPGYEANLNILEKILGENLYKELRSSTMLDEFFAAIGSKVVVDKLAHFLPDIRRMPKKKYKKDEKDDPKKRMPDQNKLKRAIQDAMGQAKSDCEEMECACAGWGTAPGSPQKLPYKEKIALAKRIKDSRILWALAKICGRFRNLALSTQRTKIKKGNEEVYSIETGGNVDRILPSEMARIAHPYLQYLFYHDIAQGTALQFALRDRKKEAKGPIVCAIDNSGSMSGDREVWSKAIALGLLEICVMQRRKFIGIHFGYNTEISIHPFEWNTYTLDQVLNFAEHFFGGGTDFEKPLDVCAHEVGANPRADIIFITDGECDVGEPWLRNFNGWRDENEVTVWSVLIDPYGHGSRNEEHNLKKFSNGGVIFAKDIQDDKKQLGEAVPIFGSV